MRLTIGIKNEIASKLYEPLHKKRHEELAAMKKKIEPALAEFVAPIQVREMFKVRELRQYIMATGHVSLYDEGQYITRIMFEELIPCGRNTLQLSKLPTELRSAVDAYAKREDEVKIELNEAWRKLLALLASFSTYEKLAKAWPDAAAFVPVPEGQRLPSVTVDEISKILNA